MKNLDISLVAVMFVFSVGLFIVGGIAEKYLSSKWKLLYVVPVLVCMVIAAFAGLEISLLGAYLGAAVLIAGFFKDKKSVRRLASAIAALGTAASLLVCLTYKGYRSPNFVKDFEKGFTDMKNYYVLGEHKGIDWDSLYEKYHPMFEAANKEHDEVANAAAWAKFCIEFYDGHVNFQSKDPKANEKAVKNASGNDYGLVMMRYEDGRVVAINVAPDSAAEKAGIHVGTVITSWDGSDPFEVAKSAELLKFDCFPDDENRDFYAMLYGGGVGGDSVEVKFIDDSGSESAVTLDKMGCYYERVIEVEDVFDTGVNIGNLTFTEVSDDTILLRIKSMQFDTKSEEENYFGMKNEIRDSVLQYKEKGYKNLIIDIRCNGGGSGKLVRSLGELFAPEGEHFYCRDGVWDQETAFYAKDKATGKYIGGVDNYFRGEGLLGDGKVVLLVNALSVSASDHMANVFSTFDNVTIMGFTKSMGSAQGICGVYLDSGVLCYSSSLILTKDNEPFVDTGIDRKGTDILDIRIPFDETALDAIFVKGEDYVLDKALEYLSK